MTVDPVHAVLSPPEVASFRALAHLGDEPLDVDFDGWSKLALLSTDRAFLFPRRGREESLLHGARVCEHLSGIGVACVPAVLDRWAAEQLPSGPCVAFERRNGRSWTSLEVEASLDDWERMLSSLGEVIATWHCIVPEDLPEPISGPASFSKDVLSTLLGDSPIDAVLAEAAPLARDERAWLSTWQRTIETVRTSPPVFLHGDVCENQLLVDNGLKVTTVLDWDTGGVGHRLHDFDFGEWGFGIYRWESEFGRLRKVLWNAYRVALGDAGADLPPPEVVHLVFVLADLLQVERLRRRGILDAWGARRERHLRDAIGSATAAAQGALRE